MTHQFSFKSGASVTTLTLVKHPAHLAQLAAGRITADDLTRRNWYLRMTDPTTGRPTYRSLKTSDVRVAERQARGWTAAATATPDDWEEFKRAKAARASLTVARLADDYLAAGCPDREGRPRAGRSLDDLRTQLTTALTWWGPRSVAALDRAAITAYAAHRQAAPRSAELEVNALRNVLRWSVDTGRITHHSLPFVKLRRRDDIEHSPDFAPASADELHALVRWLLERPHLAVYGAQFLFQSYTGLRPGEPGNLRWDARHNPVANEQQPGARWTRAIEGKEVEFLAVQRIKRGQNPVVEVHPALADFLRAWRDYTARTWPLSPWFFPHPRHPLQPAVPHGDSRGSGLRYALNQATVALGLPERHPHAARAYFTAVLRAEGVPDILISMRLGQTGGEQLVRNIYGDPTQAAGTRSIGWLPLNGEPAWTVLSPSTTTNNIIAL